MLANLARVLNDSTPGLRSKVLGIYGLLLTLNLAAWALTFVAAVRFPALLPLALTAYGFGLRHAVDADHISAIDNVTRKLLQEKKKPVGVGLFFSLGHSTVVVLLATAVAAGSAFITGGLQSDNSGLKQIGGLIGTSVSALFLFAIAIMNLVILVEIVRTFRKVTTGGVYDEEEIDAYLNQRGFFARIFRGLFKTIDASWKMYPVGFLFGLGFDTATEVGLLALSGTFAAQHVPFYVILLLPLLFTAGMSLADTTDGVMMLGAYGWAFVKPIRKLFYNMSITLISVLVALLVGSIEVLQILAGQLHLSGGLWAFVGNLDFGVVGFGIIGILVLAWLISTIVYRVNRYDDMEPVRTIAAPTGIEPAPEPRETVSSSSAA
jgi:high-affinity nickel-transport protein